MERVAGGTTSEGGLFGNLAMGTIPRQDLKECPRWWPLNCQTRYKSLPILTSFW